MADPIVKATLDLAVCRAERARLVDEIKRKRFELTRLVESLDSQTTQKAGLEDALAKAVDNRNQMLGWTKDDKEEGDKA